MTANIDSMAYYGEVPWHHLGTPVAHAMTSAEAITLGGLGWSVRAESVTTESGIRVPKLRVVLRSDTNGVLGVVSDQYSTLQNKDAFSFFDRIVGEGKAIFHTVGSLDRGKKIWLLAKLPETIVVAGHDVVEEYLLLANSHDGGMAIHVGFNPIRVVCENTLMAALSKAPGQSIIHRGNLATELKTATEAIGLASKYYGELGQIFHVFAAKPVTQSGIDNYLNAVFPVPNIPDNFEDSRVQKWLMMYEANQRVHSAVEQLHERGTGADQPGIRGTLWGIYNAVTEWADHTAISNKSNPNAQLKSMWFGDRAAIKANAFQQALVMSRS